MDITPLSEDTINKKKSSTSSISPDLKIENFSRNKIKPKRLYTNLIRFKRFYSITKFKSKLYVCIFLGVLTALLAAMLIESTGLYAGGTSAFFQGIARITYVCMSKYSGTSENVNNVIFNGLF
jgi:hypothetical protein